MYVQNTESDYNYSYYEQLQRLYNYVYLFSEL